MTSSMCGDGAHNYVCRKFLNIGIFLGMFLLYFTCRNNVPLVEIGIPRSTIILHYILVINCVSYSLPGIFILSRAHYTAVSLYNTRNSYWKFLIPYWNSSTVGIPRCVSIFGKRFCGIGKQGIFLQAT